MKEKARKETTNHSSESHVLDAKSSSTDLIFEFSELLFDSPFFAGGPLPASTDFELSEFFLDFVDDFGTFLG